MPQAEAIRAALKGKPVELCEIIRSRAHGAVQAIAGAMVGLRMAMLLGRERCRERDLVLAMIAARVRRRDADANEATFDIDNTPNDKQCEALDLINTIRL